MSTASQFSLLQITATELQQLLTRGKLTSVELIKRYLTQITQYNEQLRAVIQITPESLLLARARMLDEERAQQLIRGPLHGIPVLIKDNIHTHPSLGLGTTCGSFALMHAKVKKNAPLVDQIIEAGAIILGKANLSEFADLLGIGVPCGWSAVGGQTQSAYIKKAFQKTDAFNGHSNPGGSSSGPAVAISAGFTPLAVGTETCGSLITPANRAALYTIKPTIGLISQAGIIPVSDFSDAAGPMAKSAQDLAHLLQVLVDPKQSHHIPPAGYSSALKFSWGNLKIGCLDPHEWYTQQDEDAIDEAFFAEQRQAIKAAYQRIENEGANIQYPVSLISAEKLDIDGESALKNLWKGNLARLLNEHLASFETSNVRNLQEIVSFNDAYRFLELPKGVNQQKLINSLEVTYSTEESQCAIDHCHHIARTAGIDATMKRFNIDVILGPADSALDEIVAASGYPAISLPLTTYSGNGRPFGLMAIALQYQETTLITLASAWEATFPDRPVPHGILLQKVSKQ